MIKKLIGLKITSTHGFTVDKLRELEKKTICRDDRIRIAAVRLIMEGYMTVQVSELLNLARQTVSIHVKNFESGGIEGLLERKKAPGNSPFLTTEEQMEFRQIVLEKYPFDFEFSQAANWTLKTLVQLIELKFGITMSVEGVRKMLKRLGFSHTRATYVLEKAEVAKQKAFQKEVDMIHALVKKNIK